MKRNIQKGFTQIEQMIVVAIIGILAAVAIPQYRDYTIKAKVGNALSSVDTLKTAVALCIQTEGVSTGGTATTCASGGTGGVPTMASTNEVASATVSAAGVIVATLASGIGTNVDGLKITWTPVIKDTSVVWTITTTVTQPAALAAITKNSAT